MKNFQSYNGGCLNPRITHSPVFLLGTIYLSGFLPLKVLSTSTLKFAIKVLRISKRNAKSFVIRKWLREMTNSLCITNFSFCVVLGYHSLSEPLADIPCSHRSRIFFSCKSYKFEPIEGFVRGSVWSSCCWRWVRTTEERKAQNQAESARGKDAWGKVSASFIRNGTVACLCRSLILRRSSLSHLTLSITKFPYAFFNEV